MKKCASCDSEAVIEILKIDAQPISNRFLPSPDKEEYTYPITLAQCSSCGLIQLVNLVPWRELIPQYSWIKYNEPEKHLDDLVKTLMALDNINDKSKILGVSYKEDTTLARFTNQGYNNIYRLDTKEDLGIENPNAGIESVQGEINEEKAKKVVNKRGNYDLVIARHILEHCYNPEEFIASLKMLTADGGYIVFEIPDTSYSLKNNIYTMIWEEHTLYFTPETFRNFFSFFGLKVIDFITYEYPNENSLAVITKIGDTERKFPSQKELKEETARMESFASGFLNYKSVLHNYLSEYKKRKGNISFLGAGHHSISFINYFDLGKYIDFVADDNSNKQGMFMPGSSIPILGSDRLLKNDIKLCLTALSPESEEKVLQKNKDFLDNNGKMASIFKGSKYALENSIKESNTEIKTRKTGEGIFYFDELNPTIKKKDMEFLKSEAEKAQTKRARFCTHTSPEDKIHDMLIVLDKDTYVRPHKHFKPESGHVIEGTADLIFFDEQGNITKVVQLDSSSSGKDFYYRINSPVYHTQIVTSNQFVFHESTSGPFIREETVYAPWAPADSDKKTVEDYINALKEKIKEKNEIRKK